jgi:hypothetical protein
MCVSSLPNPSPQNSPALPLFLDPELKYTASRITQLQPVRRPRQVTHLFIAKRGQLDGDSLPLMQKMIQ